MLLNRFTFTLITSICCDRLTDNILASSKDVADNDVLGRVTWTLDTNTANTQSDIGCNTSRDIPFTRPHLTCDDKVEIIYQMILNMFQLFTIRAMLTHPPINFIQISSQAIYLNQSIGCYLSHHSVRNQSTSVTVCRAQCVQCNDGDERERCEAMWMLVLCGAVIWLKWNCFGLWPLERLQQKRASRTSAHIYCHPLYHRIDLVLVSGIGLRIASLSAFLKTSTIFPFCFCHWHFSFPIIFVISSVRCIARIRLSICSIVCYVVTECVRLRQLSSACMVLLLLLLVLFQFLFSFFVFDFFILLLVYFFGSYLNC